MKKEMEYINTNKTVKVISHRNLSKLPMKLLIAESQSGEIFIADLSDLLTRDFQIQHNTFNYLQDAKP